jgi:hypothetical protein
MSDERIEIPVVGSEAALNEFSSFMAAFPGVSADFAIERLNAEGYPSVAWIPFAGLAIDLANAVRNWLQKQPTKDAPGLTVKGPNGIDLFIARPTKLDRARAFDLIEKAIKLSIGNPPAKRDPSLPADWGVVRGFAPPDTSEPKK